jgi:hypothetical protein
VTLHQEPMRRYHIEDPQDPENELVFYEDGFGSYTVLVIEVAPQEDINNMWKMNFDGAKSQSGMGAGIVFTSPKGIFHVMLFIWNLMELTM